jgi:hypothetical protein
LGIWIEVKIFEKLTRSLSFPFDATAILMTP